MNKKLIILLSFLLTFYTTYGQNDGIINLKEPIKLVVADKINIGLPIGTELIALNIQKQFNPNNEYFKIIIEASKSDGSLVRIPFEELKRYKFIEIDNVNKTWEKNLLNYGVYNDLILNGYQYNIRNELKLDAEEYYKNLNVNYRFFYDEYFEDYLSILANKIHQGILNDSRPGNLFVKIVKDHSPNAGCLPNGLILITTSLLSTIQSEDELVGILAHEIAHFVLDHHVRNYNKEVERNKRAEFWSTFITAVAAGTESFLATKNDEYMPGSLTISTAYLASAFSDAVLNRLGIKFNQAQEREADKVAKEVLEVLKYNSLGLSAALVRIRDYYIATGNSIALSGNGTHPDITNRIAHLGGTLNIKMFMQPDYLKKVSLITSFNAWCELWSLSHHLTANELSSRNIELGVATEPDYIVKAVVQRRLSNTKESNEEVIRLLEVAKALNVTPLIQIYKEEGITYLRLDAKEEAKKSFQTYLVKLNEQLNQNNNALILEDEILWTKNMIFKIDKL